MPVVVKNLNYTYNPKTPFAKQALLDVNLTINDGEFIGIIGHTGSGKSTFVQHLNGLIKLTDGEIIVNDINLNDKKVDYLKLRSLVGMVFQYPEYQLFADTVKADIAFGPKNMKLPAEEVNTRVSEALKLVGLNEEEIGEKSPFDLSGGERRRAAIAGVLAMKPKILVLDEPTAGLDPMGKREILQLMAKIRAEQNATIIMISHDMNEIYENVDRVAVFVNGTIKHDMPTEELFQKVKIEEYGLEMPAMAVIKKKLSKIGVVINGRTVTEVFNEIVKAKGGKNV